MVRSTDPGTMIALRHKENDYHLFELLGLERLVSFSSWTLKEIRVDENSTRIKK